MLKGDTFLGQRIEYTLKGSGDFTHCMENIVPAMERDGKGPSDPEAFCAWYEHDQSGHWPGEKSANARDAFLGPQDNPFESLLKAWITKIGWTDEARAAAAEARRHGYAAVSKPGGQDGGLHMAHPEGHSLFIGPKGDWGHTESRGGQDSKMSYGKNVDSLAPKLTGLHGAPTQSGVSPAKMAGSVAQSHGFSHWGTAHPNVGGPQDVYSKPGHAVYVDQKTGNWTHETDTKGVGAGIGRVVGQGAHHELDAHLAANAPVKPSVPGDSRR